MSLEEFDNFCCPYCGEINQLHLDMTAGARQQLIVDCEVCCAPIVLTIRLRGETVDIQVKRENE